ncbi:MAG: hypothetical protein U5J63_11305 [Fodinibius sp.]|nr:hypothetical protein [Fodinibius sp.]
MTAPFTFAIQKSEEEIAKEKKTIRESTPPIFHRDHDVKIDIQTKLDSLFQSLQPLTSAYEEWQQAQTQQCFLRFSRQPAVCKIKG